MSKLKATILGVCTVWPIVYMVLFMSVIFSQFINFSTPSQTTHTEMPLIFKIIFPLHFMTMVWIIALTVIYIRHIFKSSAVPAEKKTLWAVVIFLGNMVSMPIYWYLYIWKKVE